MAKRRDGSGKAKAQRQHASRRAQERYGQALGRRAQARIIEAIQRGDSTIAWRTSLRASVHDVNIEGMTYRVVYDAKRKTIASFLPYDPTETQ